MQSLQMSSSYDLYIAVASVDDLVRLCKWPLEMFAVIQQFRFLRQLEHFDLWCSFDSSQSCSATSGYSFLHMAAVASFKIEVGRGVSLSN